MCVSKAYVMIVVQHCNLSWILNLSVLFLILKNNASDSSGDRNSLWDGDIIMVGTQEKDEDEGTSEHCNDDLE